MKTLLSFALVILFKTSGLSQEQKLVSMSKTYQKAYQLGSKYYETGLDKPFTGVLYG